LKRAEVSTTSTRQLHQLFKHLFCFLQLVSFPKKC